MTIPNPSLCHSQYSRSWNFILKKCTKLCSITIFINRSNPWQHFAVILWGEFISTNRFTKNRQCIASWFWRCTVSCYAASCKFPGTLSIFCLHLFHRYRWFPWWYKLFNTRCVHNNSLRNIRNRIQTTITWQRNQPFTNAFICRQLSIKTSAFSTAYWKSAVWYKRQLWARIMSHKMINIKHANLFARTHISIKAIRKLDFVFLHI